MGNSSAKEMEGEVRMVMIGRTGSGKSATGNSILNKKIFPSKRSSSSVTKQCQRGQSVFEKDKMKYNLLLVDTPGLFDTNMSNDDVCKEIVKCIGISSPGPHALLFMISLAGRFTKEEVSTAKHFIDLFGDKLRDFLIIVFTHGDNLEKSETIEMRIREAPDSLKELIKSSGKRFILFNNEITGSKEKKKQLSELMELVSKVIEDNEGNCYSDDMYKKAEEELQKRMEEIRRKEKEEKRQEKKQNIQELEIKIERERATEKSANEKKIAEFQKQIEALQNEKAQEAKINELELRKVVRSEVEEGGTIVTQIGRGLLTGAKCVVEAAVVASGLPGFLQKATNLFGEEEKK